MKKNAHPTPDSVRHFGSEISPTAPEGQGGYKPLYLQVALWGMSLGRPFTPEELARTFGFSPAKAGNIIRYICGLGADKVHLKKTYRRGGSPMKKQVLGSVEILAVAARSAGQRQPRRRAPAPVMLNEIRHSLLRPERRGENDEQ